MTTGSTTANASAALREPGDNCWVLTGSQENFAATAQHRFTVAGFKERRRKQAESMAPGDRIIFYLTKVQQFGAAVEITSEMFEDRTKIWPGKPGAPDQYPWRVETKPLLVLDPDSYVPAEDLAPELDHIKKWPAEHWKLAFQGQLRTFSALDESRVIEAMRAALPASTAA